MVPSRAASNTKYIDAVGRIVMGGAHLYPEMQLRAPVVALAELQRYRFVEKETERAFADTSQVRKAAIMTRVMGLIHELCKSGIHSTKRDIFYTDVKLFKKQDESDGKT